ncbi:potassium channel family protein [Alkalihalobacillus sp. TS-13]|uniref:potassium channel family protein n=1 Tax=Alkalihalobacillus sp. TS-13 TaxID=2842455 RepID=UPI001C88AD0B|nr:potassium channel family protein [Alkalihalobacillus sp. TS-13]
MDLLIVVFVFVSVFIIVQKSLVSFFRHPRHLHKKSRKFISFDDLMALFIVYSIIILGFGAIYFSLLMVGIPVLMESGTPVNGSYAELTEVVSYFSAVTLLSVGYGDITPIGIGRWISIIEALVGYLLPAAFVLSTVVETEWKSD